MVRIPRKRAATQPGEMLLEEFLIPMGVSQKELADSIRVPFQRINEIVAGKRGLTPSTRFVWQSFLECRPDFGSTCRCDVIWRTSNVKNTSYSVRSSRSRKTEPYDTLNADMSNYLMPAEWEPHEAVWLGWPHNASDWPGKITAIHFVYSEIVKKITASETARILVNDEKHETKAHRILQQAGVDLSTVEFFRVPTNRGWTRDMGPIFVRDGKETAIAGFKFNAWAKYSDHELDARVAERLAKKLKKKYLPVTHKDKPFVLEGGAIDVNGRGTLITTEECLLDDRIQVRNPGLTRKEYEKVLNESLGAKNVLWLGKGIAGDDTHGHVDDLCRFVDSKTVILCRERDPQDANYRLLEENRERAESFKLENGSKPSVHFLPMPAPLLYRGQRLPASYANFLITNSSVLVPTFNDPNDRIALGILAELFPKRTVVGIHAVDLVWGLGTLHCLSQQQPA